MHRKYLIAYFAFLAVAFLPVAINILFVFRARENSAYAAIVAEQQRTGAIYGSAFNGGSARYRLELAAARGPEVAAVGSSRVMSFRQEFFTRPFANLGGVVANLDEGRNFTRLLSEGRLPPIILFGIDYWWMNQTAAKLEPIMDGNVLTFRKLTAPLLMVGQGKLEPGLFLDLALGRSVPNPMMKAPTLGINALKTMNGMRPDGSVHYGIQFFEPPDRNPEARDTWRAQALDFRIRGGRPIEKRNLDLLKAMIAALEAGGGHVVAFIPPVAPSIRDGIEKDPVAKGFVDRFRADAAATLGPRLFDFHDGVAGGDDDCEYIDGFHGGEVTYVRMLREMAKSDPALAAVADTAAIDAAIAAHKGHALAILERDAYTARETDFLDLGCAK